MNKKEFIKSLSEKINYNEDSCIIINNILEENFFISRKSEDKIISELMSKLNINKDDANDIYKIAKDILIDEIKYKLKHPIGKSS